MGKILDGFTTKKFHIVNIQRAYVNLKTAIEKNGKEYEVFTSGQKIERRKEERK